MNLYVHTLAHGFKINTTKDNLKLKRKQYYFVVAAQWLNGSMAQWLNDSMAQWFNGSMDQWLNGSMTQRHSYRSFCQREVLNYFYDPVIRTGGS